MGCCDSRVNSPSFLPDPKYSNKKPKEISLLLLGPGGSGKSTILKQMSKIYNGKIDNKLLIDATQYIRENIIEDIYWLCTAYNQLKKGNINVLPNNNEYMYNSNNNSSNNSNDKNGIIKDINNSNGNVSDGSSNSELLLESQYEEIIDYIYNIAKEGSYDDIKFDNKLANKIKTLWNIDLFQKLFQKRRQSHIMDHTPYFMNNIDRIAKPDYKATFDDYVCIIYFCIIYIIYIILYYIIFRYGLDIQQQEVHHMNLELILIMMIVNQKNGKLLLLMLVDKEQKEKNGINHYKIKMQ